ncbi:MAG: DUF4352 domain-containing protein [Longicatena sp.]
MEILQFEHDKHKVLLTQDYCPNQAMKNEFQTLFFTCQLANIELAGKELKDFIVDEGAQFLVLHVRIKNITNEILDMYKDDFMISFDDEGPFEPENNFGVEHQLADEYALKPQEEIKGNLIFIISASAKKMVFTYTEYFDDESEGKTYKLKYKLN